MHLLAQEQTQLTWVSCQSCKSISAIRAALVENTNDPALATGLLIELGRALSQGGAVDEEGASGLKWIKTVQYELKQDEELEHAELAAALACKSDFTWQEWEAFRISHLRMDQYIKSGDEYFRPAQGSQQATLDCIFGLIERYKSLARLQVHALNVLSLCLNSSETALVSFMACIEACPYLPHVCTVPCFVAA